jgi:hypothetical protein
MPPRSVHSHLDDEIASLRGLDLEALRARWHSVFRRRAPSHLPRHILFRILAYRLQTEQFGDLDRDTLRLLGHIASDSPNAGKWCALHRSRSDLKPGTLVVREWNGQLQRVMVLAEGFAWNGKTYRSLSEVAFAITGTRWSGPKFFGLRDKPKPGTEVQP